MDDAIKILNGFFNNNMMDAYQFRITLRGDKYQLVTATFEGVDAEEETCFISERNKDEFEKRLWTFIAGVQLAKNAKTDGLF